MSVRVADGNIDHRGNEAFEQVFGSPKHGRLWNPSNGSPREYGLNDAGFSRFRHQEKGLCPSFRSGGELMNIAVGENGQVILPRPVESERVSFGTVRGDGSPTRVTYYRAVVYFNAVKDALLYCPKRGLAQTAMRMCIDDQAACLFDVIELISVINAPG